MDTIRDSDLFFRIDDSVAVAVSDVNMDTLVLEHEQVLHEQVNPRPSKVQGIAAQRRRRTAGEKSEKV